MSITKRQKSVVRKRLYKGVDRESGLKATSRFLKNVIRELNRIKRGKK